VILYAFFVEHDVAAMAGAAKEQPDRCPGPSAT